MSVAVAQHIFPLEKFVVNHDSQGSSSTEGSYPPASANALAISEPWDIIQLHPDLKAEWDEITSHYKRIGLTYSEEVIWSLNRKELGAHIGYHPSVALFGPRECQYWGDYEWLAAADWIRANNNFLLLANEFGIEVPATRAFASVLDIDESTLQTEHYPCYLKPAFPAVGLTTRRCRDSMELRDAIKEYPADMAVQLQEVVLAESILNLQYRVSGDQITHLASTENSTTGYTRRLCSVNASHQAWQVVEPMAYWLKNRGMKGVFSFDVALLQHGQNTGHVALGCHPGFNQASYPGLIAQKLGINEWCIMEFSTRHHSLGELDIADIEYEKVTDEGVIIVNWGAINEGRLTLMLAGSPAYQEALQIELIARL